MVTNDPDFDGDGMPDLTDADDGDGVLDVNDAFPLDSDKSVVARLSNISTRGLVKTADEVMIGGMIITGDTAKAVVVRARGLRLLIGSLLALPVNLARKTIKTLPAISAQLALIAGLNQFYRLTSRSGTLL
ncbi:MAG: hypothetical protein ACJAX5_003245 [Patiriisocius sp.]